ncbi:LysE family translocator [Rhodospirillum rubrum]|uniref:Lysine exporter protein (LYSE/YGGA) n=1 Tax=Rhodospirillum rubrum (strain ATCC 11170 / ATH 1.1.1 / DSM 467 / LMG 4362 / NCIMB 8255 / S1) TaxID=269796 RepID=Q2RYE2_RHORT|nr:LysE family translocator [Rhodospirillum rubrum]ABC20853.1 Lysine exporter protein (LYSE/YGGA) [Rhodospirillum rubrum ATCC 11170]AEO46520.1 lysine exporter protein LysE/YggA [Rhodospirillum rubrum F11]MBK5952409.1 LysE family translocator [Rhodospirillum rubrum]QXG80555.1 LysE family translocator [Rhodospirillum rubrum]
MTIETWGLFCAAVFVLAGTPGPNMLHVLTRSVKFGARRSIPAMLGCLSALMTILLASATGLSAVLIAAPGLFEALRYVGVAYLVYLGVKAWRGEEAAVDPALPALPVSISAWALFRGGFLIGISNPKAILFAAAFLPQFVSQSAPQIPQFAVLIVTFAAVELFWYAIYGMGGQKLAGYLIRPALKRAFNRLTGGIFMGFGVALLRVRF